MTILLPNENPLNKYTQFLTPDEINPWRIPQHCNKNKSKVFRHICFLILQTNPNTQLNVVLCIARGKKCSFSSRWLLSNWKCSCNETLLAKNNYDPVMCLISYYIYIYSAEVHYPQFQVKSHIKEWGQHPSDKERYFVHCSCFSECIAENKERKKHLIECIVFSLYCL